MGSETQLRPTEGALLDDARKLLALRDAFAAEEERLGLRRIDLVRRHLAGEEEHDDGAR